MDNYSDPGYVQAKNDASTAYSNYGTAQNATLTMPDMLKAVLDKKFASNDNPLNTQREAAYGDYAGATNTGYQSVLPQNNNGMIFNPSSQQEQIQGRRDSALMNILGLNRVIESGLGGINNIIDSTTKNYQAQENAAKTKAELARQKVADLFEEIAAKESIRQFNESLKVEQQRANDTGKATQKSPLELAIEKALAEQMGIGGEKNTVQPTEAKPTAKPKTKSNRLYTSEQGQWMFDWGSSDWIPIMD